MNWRFWLALVLAGAPTAQAVPLQTIGTFCGSFPDQCSKGTESLLAARGIGTNTYYVLEVDPATGEIPASITLPAEGVPGTPVPTDALYVAGTDGTNLRGLKTDTSGELQVDVLTLPTPASPTGRSYADSVRNDYASVNVTTGAWVQLIASTAATINNLTVFDSCGQTLEIGTGAALSETRKLIVPPGGIDGIVPLAIAAGTRVSIRAISATCSSGEIDITGLN